MSSKRTWAPRNSRTMTMAGLTALFLFAATSHAWSTGGIRGIGGSGNNGAFLINYNENQQSSLKQMSTKSHSSRSSGALPSNLIQNGKSARFSHGKYVAASGRAMMRRFHLYGAANGEEENETNTKTNNATSTVVETETTTSENGPEQENSSSNSGLTLQKASSLLNTFWSMAFPYYQQSQAGRRLFYGMILLTLMNSGVSVIFSYISKDFWNALSSKDADEFYQMMIKFGGALVIGAPVAVLYRFQREQLAVHWREWMTDRTLQLYNSNRVYYSLERDMTGSGGDTSEVPTNGSTDSGAIGATTTTPTTTNGVTNGLANEVSNGASNEASNEASTEEANGAVNGAIVATARIDNPDQRITEDVRTFTAFSLQLFITVVTSLIDLVSFSLILYSIQPQLFGTIIAYALFGTVTTTALGNKLVGLNFSKLRREADLRYLLVRIRENAESIAFYGGEDVEGREVSSRLSKVVENRREINVAQRNLEYFTTAYHYLIQVVPVAVVAPQYFAGTIQLGVISQSVGAFNHILNDLSVIVNQYEQLSSFSAGIERLSTFMTAMRDSDPARSNEDGLLDLPMNMTDVNGISAVNETNLLENTSVNANNILIENKELQSLGERIQLHLKPASIGTSNNILLTMNDLSLTTPDRKRSLVQNLDLTVNEGQNLLIVGNSGAGKSSLLRAIAGLWTAGSGQITRVPDENVYFLPQRPYCALGSLKDQLLYPSTESLDANDYPDGHRLSRAHLLRREMSDQDLLDVLDMVDLHELPFRFGDGDPVKGLNAVVDWGNTLSLGEQQRLAFGRVVVNQPQLVILDEATSALDVASEAKMYSLLRNMATKELRRGGEENKVSLSPPGLTFISVGHRPTLLAYHDVKLRLNGGSDYIIEPIEKSVSIPTDMPMM